MSDVLPQLGLVFVLVIVNAMARPLAVLSKVTRPVVWLLSHSTDLAVRLIGADPKQQREGHR